MVGLVLAQRLSRLSLQHPVMEAEEPTPEAGYPRWFTSGHTQHPSAVGAVIAFSAATGAAKSPYAKAVSTSVISPWLRWGGALTPATAMGHEPQQCVGVTG